MYGDEQKLSSLMSVESGAKSWHNHI